MKKTKTKGAESFIYNGYEFHPVGNILGGWKIKSDSITAKKILKIENYTHEEFYKIARKHHASVDVYEVNGELWMPCSGGIAGIRKTNNIKTLAEYERWYQ